MSDKQTNVAKKLRQKLEDVARHLRPYADYCRVYFQNDFKALIHKPEYRLSPDDFDLLPDEEKRRFEQGISDATEGVDALLKLDKPKVYLQPLFDVLRTTADGRNKKGGRPTEAQVAILGSLSDPGTSELRDRKWVAISKEFPPMTVRSGRTKRSGPLTENLKAATVRFEQARARLYPIPETLRQKILAEVEEDILRGRERFVREFNSSYRNHPIRLAAESLLEFLNLDERRLKLGMENSAHAVCFVCQGLYIRDGRGIDPGWLCSEICKEVYESRLNTIASSNNPKPIEEQLNNTDWRKLLQKKRNQSTKTV